MHVFPGYTAESTSSSASNATVNSELFEESEQYLELMVNGQPLGKEITLISKGERHYLPFIALGRAIDLGLEQAGPECVAGFVFEEDRRFALDPRHRVLERPGSGRQTLGDGEVFSRDGEVYVSPDLAENLLAIRISTDPYRATVDLLSDRPLPFELKRERERRAAGLASRSDPPPDVTIGSPYSWFDWPFVDIALNAAGVKGGKPRYDYSVRAAGDLLMMTGTAYVAGSTDGGTPAVRLGLERKDPDGRLLGPLGATSVELGQVDTPAIPLVSGPVATLGFGAHNHPLFQPDHVDRHTFEGQAPAGWDVELYSGEILAGYQEVGPDGRYRFADVPVHLGFNDFRLEFYGPNGQRRTRAQPLYVGEGMVPTGKVRYRTVGGASGGLREPRPSGFCSLDLGLDRHLTANLSIGRLANGRSERDFGAIGLRTFWDRVAAYGDAVLSHRGTAGQLGMLSRLGPATVQVRHLMNRNLGSDLLPDAADPLTSRTSLDLATMVTASDSLGALGISVGAAREVRASRSEAIRVLSRVGVMLAGTNISHDLSWNAPPNGITIEGSLSVGRRFGPASVRSDLAYGPKGLTHVTTSAHFPIARDFRLGGSSTYLVPESIGKVSVDLSWLLPSVSAAMRIAFSTRNELEVAAGLSFGLMRDPRSEWWVAQPRPLSGTGAALVRVTGAPATGVASGAEPDPRQVSEVAIDAGSVATDFTDHSGAALLTGLPAYQPVSITLRPDSLPEGVVPRFSSIGAFTRPGKVVDVEIPLQVSGEITGTAYLEKPSGRVPVGDLEIEVVDDAGQVRYRTQSDFDGFYAVSGIAPGHYRVRVGRRQARDLGLEAGPSRKFRVDMALTSHEGLDLVCRLQGQDLAKQNSPPGVQGIGGSR